MKVILECRSSSTIGVKKYRNVLFQVGGVSGVEVDTDFPLTPGSYYYVMLKGIFGGCNEGRPCVGEVERFSVNQQVVDGITYEQEINWLKQRQSEGIPNWP